MRAEMRRLKKIQQSKNQQSETRCFHSFVQKGRLLLKEIAWKIKRHKWRIFCHRVWICRLWLRIPERRHQSAQRNGEFLEHTKFFLDFTVSKLYFEIDNLGQIDIWEKNIELVLESGSGLTQAKTKLNKSMHESKVEMEEESCFNHHCNCCQNGRYNLDL